MCPIVVSFQLLVFIVLPKSQCTETKTMVVTGNSFNTNVTVIAVQSTKMNAFNATQ